MSALHDQAQVIVEGTITKVELVPGTDEVIAGLGATGSVELRLTLASVRTQKGAAAATASVTWSDELFYGTEAEARWVHSLMVPVLGSGPVGSRALLYGRPAMQADGTVMPGEIGILDGVVEDETGSAVLTPDPDWAPRELNHITTALAATRRPAGPSPDWRRNDD